jgi:hypothetical protein
MGSPKVQKASASASSASAHVENYLPLVETEECMSGTKALGVLM